MLGFRKVGGVGAQNAFGYRYADFLEVLNPIGGYLAVGISPVHRPRLEQVLIIADKTFIDEFGTVHGSIVGKEGMVVR